MTARQFNRQAELQIELEGNQTVVIKDLRIVFSVQMYNGDLANSADIEVYNLSQSTRNLIKQRNARVNLFCGYSENTGVELLYRGEAQFIEHDRQVGDIVTKLECQDSIQKLRETKAIMSFRGRTSAATVLRRIADEFQVDIKFITNISGEFTKGYAFSGLLQDALREVTERFGLFWSFQNGLLQITKAGEDVELDAVLLNRNTGLINNVNPITYQGGDLDAIAEVYRPVFKLQSLLRPRLIPASLVQVESTDVNGTFSVVNALHYGDTRGNSWYSDIEVRNVIQ